MRFGSKLWALVQNKCSKLWALVQNYGLRFKTRAENHGLWVKTVSFDLKRQALVQNYWLYSNSKILIYNSKLWVLVHNSATS